MPVAERSTAVQDTSFRAVQRQLALQLPGGTAVAGSDAPVDLLVSAIDPPRLVEATLIESGPMRARRVPGELQVRFAAFLDGTQSSKVVRYAGGVALIHGTVAAVVRARRDRRMVTWDRPLIRRSLYVPRKHVDEATNDALDRAGIPVVDTSGVDASPGGVGEGGGGGGLAVHPFALRDAAIHRVQKAREAVEQELAEAWCMKEEEPLFIDGGLSGSERVAVSAWSVGVVKSHRALYAKGGDLQTVLDLGARERSSVFRIAPAKRVPLASWYLRLRDPHGHDPMWGLVRVEIAHPEPGRESSVSDNADEVSRWVLAECAPLSLPDARWDKMMYGVRDCEEFLKAIT